MKTCVRWTLLLVLLALTAPSLASEDGFPSPGGGVWAHGLWSDGAGTMWMPVGGAALELRRGAASASSHDTGAWGVEGIAGRGSGAKTIIAVWEEDGEISVKKGERFAAITPAGARVSALSVSPSGEILAASDKGLRVWDGSLWTAHAYPPGMGRVGAMVDGEEGETLLVSTDHRVLRFAQGALTEIEIPKMPASPQSYDGQPVVAWYDHATHTLWLATKASQVVAVDRSQSPPRARTISTDVFGSARALGGLPGSQILVLAGQSDVALIEGGVPRHLGSVTFAEGLVVDEDEPAVYLAGRDGLARLVLPGTSKPLPQPAGPAPATMAREVTMETTVEPATPVPPAHDEVMEEEPYSGDDDTDLFPFPHLRVALGPAFHMASGAKTETAFTLDVALGGRFVWVKGDEDPGWGIRTELGYGYDSSDAVGGHRLVTGLGPMWGSWIGSVALTPRFVVGSAGDQTAAGFRYGLLGEFLLGALSAEVSHQVLFLDPATLHDVRVTLGVDPLVVIGGLVLASAFDDMFN